MRDNKENGLTPSNLEEELELLLEQSLPESSEQRTENNQVSKSFDMQEKFVPDITNFSSTIDNGLDNNIDSTMGDVSFPNEPNFIQHEPPLVKFRAPRHNIRPTVYQNEQNITEKELEEKETITEPAHSMEIEPSEAIKKEVALDLMRNEDAPCVDTININDTYVDLTATIIQKPERCEEAGEEAIQSPQHLDFKAAEENIPNLEPQTIDLREELNTDKAENISDELTVSEEQHFNQQQKIHSADEVAQAVLSEYPTNDKDIIKELYSDEEIATAEHNLHKASYPDEPESETPEFLHIRSEHERPLYEEDEISTASFLLQNKMRSALIALAVIAAAGSYYIYEYQPFAPSIIRADHTPYKTKNMIENLENQTVVNVDNLINRQKLDEKNTQKQLNEVAKNIQQEDKANTNIETPKIAPEVKIDQKEVKYTTPVEKKPDQKQSDKKEVKVENTAPVVINKPQEKAKIPPVVDKLAVDLKTPDDENFDSDFQPAIDQNLNIKKPKKIETEKTHKKEAKPSHKAKAAPPHANALQIQPRMPFYIQIGSTPNPSEAKNLLNKYKIKYAGLFFGAKIQIVESGLINGRTYYRLRVFTDSLGKAKEMCSNIRSYNGSCIFGKR